MSQSYYKTIGENFGNFPYKLGLNKLSDNDGEEFNAEPVCGPGGLYYCEAKYIFVYLSHGSTICRVTIPPEAQVVKIGNKFKADQIYIEEMMELEDPGTVETIIRAGADIGADGGYPLCYASEHGYTDFAENLLKFDADVHAHDDYALRWAAENGHTDIVRLLLKAGADVKILIENGARDANSSQWAD